MTLKDLDIKETYWSGEDNLIETFYIPCLNKSIYYDRAVGFFSSSILNYISDGLYKFIINKGKMRIICSTILSQHDINMINQGYEIKKIIESNLALQVERFLYDQDKPNVKNLCWLIKNNCLDIKVCLRNIKAINSLDDNRLFHEKFGIFVDKDNNILSFLGSINESLRGWMFNEESFEVSYSWDQALNRRVQEKIERFERLWAGTANDISTYDFPIALQSKLLKASPEDPVDTLAHTTSQHNTGKKKFTPRVCQIKASEKFKESNCICMFQMATGSGKTKAALYSLQNIEGWKFLLITVPGSELVLQWEKDAHLFFPDAYIIKCGSDFGNWKAKILDLIQAKIPEQTIIISTYDSAITEFSIEKWQEIHPDAFALINDEAHNLGANQAQKLLALKPKLRIGLSATPTRNFDEEGTEKILHFFDNNTYEFSIKDAIRDNYLVEYEYFVFPCLLEQDDWHYYLRISKEISRLKSFTTSEERKKDEKKIKNEELLKRKYMERSEILKTAKNKLELFPDIIGSIPKERRILIYADSQEHLTDYALSLDAIGRDYFIYTGDKDSKIVRPKMLEEFRLGIRKILLAINCLDEGIDIPACDAALFISSSTSERQFIQRRGRVLRKITGKSRAYIYDFIVIPDYNPNDEYEKKLAKQVVFKEYQRINQIADDSINGVQTKEKIDQILNIYGLNMFNY